MLRVVEEGGRAMSGFIERSDNQSGPFSAANEMTEATKTMSEIARVWMMEPAKLAEAQGALVRSYMDVWNTAVRRMLGENVAPVVEPEPGDNRFKDPEWSSNPYFDFWKQAYLITTRWLRKCARQDRGPRRAHAPERRVLPAAAFERAVALELPHDQPRSAARDACLQRPEPRAGHGQLRRTTWRSRAIC